MTSDRLFRSRWNAAPRKANLQKLGTNKQTLAIIQELLDQHGEDNLLGAIDAFCDACSAREGGPYSLNYFLRWLSSYDPSHVYERVDKLIDFDVSIKPPEDSAADPRPRIVFEPKTVEIRTPLPRATGVIEAWNDAMPPELRVKVPTAKLRQACTALDADPAFRENRTEILSKCARLAQHPKFGANVSIEWLLKEDRYADILNGKYNSWLADVPEEPETAVEPASGPEKPYLYPERKWEDMKPIHRAVVVHTLLTWDGNRRARTVGALAEWQAAVVPLLRSLGYSKQTQEFDGVLGRMGITYATLMERYWDMIRGVDPRKHSGSLWCQGWEAIERDVWAEQFCEVE